jgi:hypothetical protein
MFNIVELEEHSLLYHLSFTVAVSEKVRPVFRTNSHSFNFKEATVSSLKHFLRSNEILFSRVVTGE